VPVVTISRQIGSLGCQVARLAAEALGYRLFWREVINEAARSCGAPDAALADIDELGLLGVKTSLKANRAYVKEVEQVIKDLAAEGDVVIVGRGGQATLRGRPDVLHVRLIAPADLRAERLRRRHQISLESAQAQVEARDHYRRNYLKRFYHIDWDDPELYDLILNTARFSPEEAAQHIVQATLKLPFPAQQETSLSYETIPGDC
jgi:cytidylate kinase